jgi:thioredoxin 1
MLEEITYATFKEKTSAGVSLVLFYKDPCPYCQTMKGVIEKFGTKVPVIKTFQINGLENAQSTKEFGVERFPEVIFFKDGRPTEARQKGLTNPQGLLALLKTI